MANVERVVRDREWLAVFRRWLVTQNVQIEKGDEWRVESGRAGIELVGVGGNVKTRVDAFDLLEWHEGRSGVEPQIRPGRP